MSESKTNLSCACVGRPIRMFNRSKKLVDKGKNLAAKGQQARDFFSDPKNIKLFQQYLKVGACAR